MVKRREPGPASALTGGCRPRYAESRALGRLPCRLVSAGCSGHAHRRDSWPKNVWMRSGMLV
jgi:hypothetical protein